MQNQPALPLTPLSEEDLARARQQKRQREGWGDQLPGLWPDIRPEAEKNQTDFSEITRTIARGS